MHNLPKLPPTQWKGATNMVGSKTQDTIPRLEMFWPFLGMNWPLPSPWSEVSFEEKINLLILWWVSPHWGGQPWQRREASPPHPSPLIPQQCNPHWTWAIQHNCFHGNAKNYTLQRASFKVSWKIFLNQCSHSMSPASVQFILCIASELSQFLGSTQYPCVHFCTKCLHNASLHRVCCILLYFVRCIVFCALHCVVNPGNKGGKLHQSSPDTRPQCTQGGTPAMHRTPGNAIHTR